MRLQSIRRFPSVQFRGTLSAIPRKGFYGVAPFIGAAVVGHVRIGDGIRWSTEALRYRG